MPLIYTLSHVPPEVSAYGMAKYSRSSSSMRESLLDLSQQKAEAFLRTFYFSYGHASIADLATVPMAIEDISLLAAMDIVDEALWDGQERSTRYQDFSHSPFYTPPGAGEAYVDAVQELFRLYQSLFDVAQAHLKDRYPQPADMKDASYRRTMKARAFDLARYALPLATLTSLGQVTNARTLESQIRRLMASSYEEVRHIAQGMKDAATREAPYNLLAARLQHLGVDIPQDVLEEMQTGPLTPTLIKYTEADTYRLSVRQVVQQWVKEAFEGTSPATPSVSLFTLADPLDDLLAGLIYEESALSYGEILARLGEYSSEQKDAWRKRIFDRRGPHDGWLRALQQRPLIFDVLMDIGAFRDVNRHRRLDKVVQKLHPQLGYTLPPEFEEIGMADDYQRAMDTHYRALSDYTQNQQPYLLPLAHRRRALLRMDFSEAAYLIELRSRSSGHFSYRRLANAMYDCLRQAYPSVAQAIRVTPMTLYDPFER